MGGADRIVAAEERLRQSLLSLVKVALQSRRPSPLPRIEGKEELVILANGPSLADTAERARSFLRGKALMAVNMFVASPLYGELKPEMYLIADPLFWIVEEKREALFGGLARHTSWPMHLFVPVRARGAERLWRPLLEKNPDIRLHYYNTTPVEGFPSLELKMMRRGLGVPRPHNVLIPSIATALRMPFRKIYLAGADHSWLPEISVTDSNEVLMHQRHFYDRDSSRPDTVSKEDLNPARLHTILYHMHVAFKAYFTLLGMARALGKEVINITPGSYIDAFPRMKI